MSCSVCPPNEWTIKLLHTNLQQIFLPHISLGVEGAVNSSSTYLRYFALTDWQTVTIV